MRKLSSLMLIACSALLVGCASVPMTSAALDSEAKKFIAEHGKANIYVNRGGELGRSSVFPTLLDGRIVGSLAPNTYLISACRQESTL